MVLMPVVKEIVGWFQKAVTWLQELPSGTKTAIVAVGGLVAAIGPLSMGLGAVLKMLPLLKAGFAAMLGPVGLVATAIAAVTTAIIGFNAAKNRHFRTRRINSLKNGGKGIIRPNSWLICRAGNRRGFPP